MIKELVVSTVPFKRGLCNLRSCNNYLMYGSKCDELKGALLIIA